MNIITKLSSKLVALFNPAGPVRPVQNKKKAPAKKAPAKAKSAATKTSTKAKPKAKKAPAKK